MPLQLHPITSPDDIETFTSIQSAAFAYGGGMTAAMAPDPLPEGWAEKNIEKNLKSWREEPDVFYLKVVDTDIDGGKMIAGAKWRINEKERSQEAAQRMYPSADKGASQATVDFMAHLSRVRKQYMGTKPFCCKPFT